jgi:hypothetical protein
VKGVGVADMTGGPLEPGFELEVALIFHHGCCAPILISIPHPTDIELSAGLGVRSATGASGAAGLSS